LDKYSRVNIKFHDNINTIILILKTTKILLSFSNLFSFPMFNIGGKDSKDPIISERDIIKARFVDMR